MSCGLSTLKLTVLLHHMDLHSEKHLLDIYKTSSAHFSLLFCMCCHEKVRRLSPPSYARIYFFFAFLLPARFETPDFPSFLFPRPHIPTTNVHVVHTEGGEGRKEGGRRVNAQDTMLSISPPCLPNSPGVWVCQDRNTSVGLSDLSRKKKEGRERSDMMLKAAAAAAPAAASTSA